MHCVRMTLKGWCKLQAWLQVIIGMVLGVAVGCLWGEQASFLKPLGTIFINAIMMMVPPVVFVSLVCGVIAVKDPAKMGRIAGKTFAIYVLTMALATVIALGVAIAILPAGHKIAAANMMQPPVDLTSTQAVSLSETLLALVPTNIMSAFAQGQILQIIVFSLLFGLAINLTGEASKPVENFFHALSSVLFKFVSLIMQLAPYGVFALMAVVSGTQGWEVMMSMLYMVGVVYLCCFIVLFLVYGPGLMLVRLNPLPFYKKMLEAQTIAFSTTSSAATLPVNLKVAESQLGIGQSIAGFVLPLGATVNMNGLSTYMGVIAIFAANLYGITLSLGDLLTIVMTSTIAAIGCAGVPAAGLVVMPMVLSSVGLPIEVIGLVAAVDRIIDMITTTLNITGDTFAAIVVAKSEGDLQVEAYYQEQAKTELLQEEASAKVSLLS